ncbi:MAG: 2-oxo-4-hydroxy-4-carboxy-5-ureidoimidazoline decarboxylase [Thermocrispum sp.]
MTADLTPEALRDCCAARAWVDGMTGGEPYESLSELLHRSDAVLASLSDRDVDAALAAHPRIGARAAGDRREAAWSRQEQSGAATATSTVKDALAAGNAEYERRFGRVFLICATGLSAEQLLAAMTARLDNDEEAERAVVREELRKIVRLRLSKLVHQ